MGWVWRSDDRSWQNTVKAMQEDLGQAYREMNRAKTRCAMAEAENHILRRKVLAQKGTIKGLMNKIAKMAGGD